MTYDIKRSLKIHLDNLKLLKEIMSGNGTINTIYLDPEISVIEDILNEKEIYLHRPEQTKLTKYGFPEKV
jgi:hypothetical protein